MQMSIKPIDMQTNIGQMHEVAKNQQVKSEAIITQQQLLEKESGEKANLTKSRLDENKKAEHATVRPDEEKEQQKRRARQAKANSQKKQKNSNTEIVENSNLGRIIDIKK
jgi:hypothetical protein